MSVIRQKVHIKSYKGRILGKVKDIAEETKILVHSLEEIVSKFQERYDELSDINIGENDFFNKYKKLNTDLELFRDKLFDIQTSIACAEDDDEADFDCEVQDQASHSFCHSSNFAEVNENAPIELPKEPILDSTKEITGLNVLSEAKSSNLIDFEETVPKSISSGSDSDIIKEFILKSDITKSSDNDDVPDSSKTIVQVSSSQSNLADDELSTNQRVQSPSQQSGSQTSFYQSISSSSTNFVLAASNDNLTSNSPQNFTISNEPNHLHVKLPNSNVSNRLESFSKTANHIISKSNQRTILPYEFPIPSNISAVVTHIIDPSNFWMQIQDQRFQEFCTYTLSSSLHEIPHSKLVEQNFCLAPFQTTNLYYRAQIQSISDTAGASAFEEEKMVNVFFVDYGCIQTLPAKELKLLPEKAYEIPTLAIHCYLTKAYPVGETWSYQSIMKFKELIYTYDIQTRVLFKKGGKHAVKLPVKVPLLDDSLSVDIAEMLILDELASKSKKYHNSLEKKSCDNSDGSFDLEETLVKKHYESGPIISNVENRISCDSGVSITSFQEFSSPQKETDVATDSISNILSRDIAITQDSLDICGNDHQNGNCDSPEHDTSECSSGHSEQIHIQNSCNQVQKFPQKFASFNKIASVANGVVNELKHMDIYPSNDLSVIKVEKNGNFPSWHVVVPPALVTFFDRNMMLVMMSNIEHPGEFYMQLTKEDSILIDDLREQMSEFYESMKNSCDYKVETENLHDNMFCSGLYEQDGNWYRVQILHVNMSEKQAKVQYVDYGNKASIAIHNLLPLTPEFAKYPAFALKCSLACVTPHPKYISPSYLSQSESQLSNSNQWSQNAIDVFLELTGFQKCLTAQVVEEINPDRSQPLQILLWNTESSQDILINKELADKGVAEFDAEILREYLKDTFPDARLHSACDSENSPLNEWDPMGEHYYRPENSYGVDMCDLEIATVGYKANDEKYICRYFTRNGYCPRGDFCEYEHIVTDSSGVTRDQEEIYSFDSVPPLPEVSMYVLLEISAVINPGHFYAVFPFGPKPVDAIDTLIQNGASMKDIVNLEPKAVTSAMSKHYSSTPFCENTTIALAWGNIVAAKSSTDGLWHRARVITVQEIAAPAEVFFVDRGYREWVDRKNIREIFPEYLHMPFQAVECFLSDVEPKNHEKGVFWTKHSREAFQKLVENQILLAYIVHKNVSTLHLKLKCTTQSDHQSISEFLVAKGHAQFALRETNMPSLQNRSSLYLPG